MSLSDPLGPSPRPGNEFATLAGGCFWCLEAVFEEIRGVLDVESGYSNGRFPAPGYDEVCTGTTGHAEVARIEFDPRRVAYADLLRVFFGIHDPTTRNRQGDDIGPQYRSAIFFHSPEQQRQADGAILEARPSFAAPILTLVEPVKDYSRAEDYHQEYFRRNPGQAYCKVVIAPKQEDFRRTFSRLRRDPAT